MVYAVKHEHHIVHIHGTGRAPDGICRQAYHVLNRGLAAGLPVDRPAPTPHNPLRVAQTPPANPRVSAKAALAA